MPGEGFVAKYPAGMSMSQRVVAQMLRGASIWQVRRVRPSVEAGLAEQRPWPALPLRPLITLAAWNGQNLRAAVRTFAEIWPACYHPSVITGLV